MYLVRSTGMHIYMYEAILYIICDCVPSVPKVPLYLLLSNSASLNSKFPTFLDNRAPAISMPHSFLFRDDHQPQPTISHNHVQTTEL